VLPARAAEEEIKERRGGLLDEAGVRAVVSPKGDGREGKGGSGTWDEAWESRAD